MSWYFVLFVYVVVILAVSGECPNACSGHGKCKAFNVCECDHKFIGNDCSMRQCQFGRAHVDAPKGDLDFSKSISAADTVILKGSQIYPRGTSEVWTDMGQNSDGVHIAETGHGYAECSNAGVCDRERGDCVCFTGYEGSSCQRASCPGGGSCSGHGVCMTISALAKLADGNQYDLWDKDTTQGCHCDYGYTGPDCSEKECKKGVDPMYYTSSEISPRYANWSIVIAHADEAADIVGTFTVTFYDVFGEDYTTSPIDYDASCATMIEAIEALPNHYVRSGTVRCLKFNEFHDDTPDDPWLVGERWGVKYTIVLPTVVGMTKQPHVNVHDQDSGGRETLQSTAGGAGRLGTHVYPNGFHGETKDLVGDLCGDVDVVLQKGKTFDYLDGLTFVEQRLLRRCLGEADWDSTIYSDESTVNNEAFVWDYGDYKNPHLIKLIVAEDEGMSSDICSGNAGRVRGDGRLCKTRRHPGFYAIMYYNQGDGLFHIYTRAAADYSNTTQFNILTTRGTMDLVSEFTATETDQHENAYPREVIMSPSVYLEGYTGAIDCESNAALVGGMRRCVERGERLFIFSPDETEEGHASNPRYPNMYTVERLYLKQGNTTHRARMVLDYSLQSSWAVSRGTYGRAYTFTPYGDEHTYVGGCSMRGECSDGDCLCHSGFHGQDCSIRDVLESVM